MTQNIRKENIRKENSELRDRAMQAEAENRRLKVELDAALAKIAELVEGCAEEMDAEFNLTGERQ